MIERVLISQLKIGKPFLIIGRVVSIDDRVTITDMSGTISLRSIPDKPLVNEGDIVKVCVEFIENDCFLTDLEILQKTLLNPVTLKRSLFNRYNFSSVDYKKILVNRQSFFREVRGFYESAGFIEINTPTLLESPGIEQYIEPFVTGYYDHHGKHTDLYLPTSPEFSLKEVLTTGIERIFEITRSYRNMGEHSNTHNPEFFMLEWYRAYEGYESIQNDCFMLVKRLASKVYNKKTINRDGKICSLDRIDKIRIKDKFAEFGIDLDLYYDDEKIFIDCVSELLGIEDCNKDLLKKDDLFFKFLMEKVEPYIGWACPAILYEYPSDMATLSVRTPDNIRYGKRFELYICGVEIANGFEELTDYNAQKANFLETIAKRSNANCTLEIPQRFLDAMKMGIPPCSGVALGLERLFMLLEGLQSIEETNIINTFV